MEFGMPTLIEQHSLEEAASLCRELRLSFIELNMNLPQYQVEALERSSPFIKIMEQYGIYYTIHLDENLNVCDFNLSVASAYRDTVRRTIAVARRLHAPVLNMHMNHGVHFTLPDTKVYLFKQYEERYRQGIKDFVTMCEEEVGGAPIQICIENTDGYHDFERRAIEEMLKSEVFGLTWDIGHSYTAKEKDVPFLLKHKNKLRHFHVHDGIGERNHLALGHGEIPIKKRLMIAKECGCRAVIETKTVQALRESCISIIS